MTRISESQAEALGIIKPKKNKYGAKKQRVNGIEFDSKAEAEFYQLLLAKEQSGEIASFRRQPRYVLQDAFEKDGKKYKPIEYVADFEVKNADGSIEVIDIKGFENRQFTIKYKMFEYRYPHLSLKRMRKVVKFGGWITTETYNRLKRQEKATQKKLETPRITKRKR